MKQTLRHSISAVLSIVLLAMTGCEEKISTDPNARLRFSCDTLRFDTVFTEMNSPTLQCRIYNPQKQAVVIDQIRLKDGRYFRLNVDGEADSGRLQHITLGGRDSMFAFVKARIDEQNAVTPVFIEDEICFQTNGNMQNIVLEAFGQDVERLSRYTIYHDTIFGGGRPYLIYDNLTVDTACTLTLREGTTLYMHDNASIVVYGNLHANGTLESPIHIQGDRLDDIYTHVPYTAVSGKWNGIYLVQTDKGEKSQHRLEHTEITSGKVGLYCSSQDKKKMPDLVLSNSRVHNFSQYGIVLQNTNATLQNTEISNCAQYCLHLSGGNYELIHNTIASYYRNTDMSIQPVRREDVAAVYINDLSKENSQTICKMYNNIITGIRKNNLVLATPLPQRYPGEFAGNYLRSDSIFSNCFKDNLYAGEKDTVFVRPFYSIDDYNYYDFHLDSVSPARGKGLSEAAAALPYDRDGNPRPTEGADLGCYQYVEKGKE